MGLFFTGAVISIVCSSWAKHCHMEHLRWPGWLLWSDNVRFLWSCILLQQRQAMLNVMFILRLSLVSDGWTLTEQKQDVSWSEHVTTWDYFGMLIRSTMESFLWIKWIDVSPVRAHDLWHGSGPSGQARNPRQCPEECCGAGLVYDENIWKSSQINQPVGKEHRWTKYLSGSECYDTSACRSDFWHMTPTSPLTCSNPCVRLLCLWTFPNPKT